MVKYICNGCNKIYDHKGSYSRHINKKKPCDFINNYIVEEAKIPAIIEQPLEIAQIDINNSQKDAQILDMCNISSATSSQITILHGNEKEILVTNNNEEITIVNNSLSLEIALVNNHKCSYCNNNYSKACNLTRHYKTCLQKHLINQKYEIQIINLKQQLDNKDREIEYLKTLVNDASSIIKISVN